MGPGRLKVTKLCLIKIKYCSGSSRTLGPLGHRHSGDGGRLGSLFQYKERGRCGGKALETRQDKTVPASFILELLDLLLKYNVFEFDRQLFLQLIGTAMGTRAAPNIADIFMS